MDDHNVAGGTLSKSAPEKTASSHVYNLPMSDQRLACELRRAQAELVLAFHRIDTGQCRTEQWAELARLLDHLGRLAPEARKRGEPPGEAGGEP